MSLCTHPTLTFLAPAIKRGAPRQIYNQKVKLHVIEVGLTTQIDQGRNRLAWEVVESMNEQR